MPSERGVSAVLGLILLIGMVATISVGMLIVASQTMDDAEQQAESERVEQSFVELSQTMGTVAMDDGTTKRVDVDAGKHGAVVMENSSRMTISYGSDSKDVNFSTIEYEGEDGTKVAYQGGAVFRETGNETQIVSAPPIDYSGEVNSETLTLPIVETTNKAHIDSGEIKISRTSDPEIVYSDVVERKYVTIEIQGPYYRGWQEYFERQAGENSIEEVYHENRTVEVKLGQSGLGTIYEYGAVAANDLTAPTAGEINGPVMYGGDLDNPGSVNGTAEPASGLTMNSVEEEIGDKIDEANNNSWDAVPSGTITAGQYVSNGDLTLDDSIDVSGGNVTLAVDGDISVTDVNVEGVSSGNIVKIYTTGEVDLNGGNTYLCIDDCHDPPNTAQQPSGGDINANHLEIYGTPDFDIAGSGGGTTIGEGVIFAPGANVGSSGTPSWNGAIIAENVEFGGNSEITYDEQLEGGPSLDTGGSVPNVTYLSVVKHQIMVGS